MKDKYELPIWNHVNFHMFYELYDSFNRNQQNITVNELIDRVDRKIGGTPSIKEFYEFMNPGIVLSLLYTNLVILNGQKIGLF